MIWYTAIENSLLELRMAYRDFVSQRAAEAPEGATLRNTKIEANGANTAIFRMMGVTESALDSLFVTLLEASAPITNDLVRLLAREKGREASTSWESRKRAFADYFGISLTRCARYGEIRAAIEIRNAVAHGGGGLTRRQMASPKTASTLKHLGVAVVGHRVIVDKSHVERCATACQAFLRSLDRAAHEYESRGE